MIFSLNYTTRWHDTDANRTVRPTQILVFMQEASNHHIKALGTDLDTLRDEHGLAFLLSKIRLALYKPLYAFENITVETWTVESRGFSFNRFFRIKRGEEIIAAADTTWALISLKTGELCKSDCFDFKFEHESPIDIGIPARFRVPKTELLNFIGERPIVYSDLDYNMHMNNTRYADMLCDFMPYDKIPQIKGISLSYLHEAAFGNTVKVYRTDDGQKFDFRTVNENGKVCLEAEIIL
ncbi:MAG: hypothetical protein E7678_00140 [Ruminococcaceae bacterium]|nr:hypothetical protein [Oscillospiraceae bacterium]